MDGLFKIGIIVGIIGFIVYLLGGMPVAECYVDATNPGHYVHKYRGLYHPTCGEPNSPYSR